MPVNEEAVMRLLKKIMLTVFLSGTFFVVFAREDPFRIARGAQLVEADTYGRTRWDNPIDRGGAFFITPDPRQGFDDVITYISLPRLEKRRAAVPLERFFTDNKEFLVEEALYSPNTAGKRRKNYWIEDCFFYDTKNGEAGLRVLNYFISKSMRKKRTFFMHWNLKKNLITGAYLLFEEDASPRKGEYDFHSVQVDGMGYNPAGRTYYYLKIEADIQVRRQGKYTQYRYAGDQRYTVHAMSEEGDRPVVTFTAGSRDTRGTYQPDLNFYFMPAYRDPGHEIEKKSPVGYLVDLNHGQTREIAVQRHTYWSEFDLQRGTLYHVSSSTGTLWATDLATGRKTASLKLGDAGDDRYRKFGFYDDATLLYYLQGRVLFIDIKNMVVRKTIDLAGRFEEFSASSPVYILTGGRALLVEARTVHNKTTGYVYYLDSIE